MKLIVRGKLSENPIMLIKHLGYHEHRDPRTLEIGYFRRLGEGFYPRLHLHFKEIPEGGIIFELHLDQKQRSLGYSRHASEGDGEAVEREIARIKEYLLK